jgi:hypothetical protein
MTGVWLLIMGVLLSSVTVTGQEESPYAVHVGTRAEWQVNAISPGTKVWLGLDLTPRATWAAMNGSTITFEVNVVSPDDGLFGDLVIDGVTFENISVRETGLNFALGFYPGVPGILDSWIPGLITDLDFVSHELNARAQAVLLNGEFHADEPIREFLDKQLKTVTFNIVQLGQNATLTYDKNSGILLEANTGFGDFFINLSIVSTTYPLEEATPVPFPGVMVLCSLTVLMLLRRKKLRKMF